MIVRADTEVLATPPETVDTVLVEPDPRQLLDALGVAVYTTDAEGRIMMYNEAAATLWGRHPRIGLDLWCGSLHLYWPDGSPMAHDECPMGATLKTGVAVRGGEAIAERPDGTRVPFMAIPTPFIDDAGDVVGAVNVLVDITDRKEAETRLRIALSVKDEFLRLVSHELKTPITTIVGNAQVLTRESLVLDDDDRAAALMDMRRESERLQNIIDNLLLLARAETGNQVELEPVMIWRAVDECAKDVGQRAGGPVTVTGNAQSALVNAEGTQLRQILTNLLSNAAKYSPPSAPIEIDVTIDAEQVAVRVLDCGPGIDDTEAERLFESFYRSAATSGNVSGVGVGLSVCKRLVDVMGGEIWARNRPAGGADFGFSLPLLHADG